MSYGTEIMDEWYIEAAIAQFEMEREIEQGIWIQRDGTAISLKDMTDTHIQNCINMLERKQHKSDITYAWIKRFKEELASRGFIQEKPMEEIKHGYWIADEDEHEICATEFTCSVCNETFSSSELTDEEFYEMMLYCPHCGAKMERVKEYE